MLDISLLIDYNILLECYFRNALQDGEDNELLQIQYSSTAVPGVPRENAFQVTDETGLKMGSATVVEFINEDILPERPLNYYVSISAMDERALDILMGAVRARAMEMRSYNAHMAARLYVACRPSDQAFMRDLQQYGFDMGDAEIRMRKILHASGRMPGPPVGCVVAPVELEDEVDMRGVLDRSNEYAVTAKPFEWLSRLQGEQYFAVYGVWQDMSLLGQMILTAYGTEGWVQSIYTETGYRKRGVATAMLAHAERVLMDKGVKTINAQVWRRNTRAMSLFQSMKYDSVEPITLYPGVDL